ncbi:hypothetical protein B0H17DRAFT_1187619 [Mycena rosella]|uniref:Uncharacterized protein n=1 Tax=Mycena rosella TaxID=1033263 RepID=A0AAD7BVL3_MYCRO|nr:hypothetical protein B0H17DRAFT_1187619 [Mycena rosella]
MRVDARYGARAARPVRAAASGRRRAGLNAGCFAHGALAARGVRAPPDHGECAEWTEGASFQRLCGRMPRVHEPVRRESLRRRQASALDALRMSCGSNAGTDELCANGGDIDARMQLRASGRETPLSVNICVLNDPSGFTYSVSGGGRAAPFFPAAVWIILCGARGMETNVRRVACERRGCGEDAHWADQDWQRCCMRAAGTRLCTLSAATCSSGVRRLAPIRPHYLA